MTSVSIIIPTFNDENKIENKISILQKKLKQMKIGYEIILINDGSTDRTSNILNKLKSKKKNIKVVVNSKNMGKSFSVRKGLKLSKYSFVILIDSDLPYFEVFPKIINKLKNNYDFVFVNRRHKKSKIKNKKLNFYQLGRYIIGYLLSVTIRIFLNFNIHGGDTQSGLKGFKRYKDFKKINFISEKFFLDLEIMFHYNIKNKRFFSVPVSYEVPNKSSIKIFSIVKNLKIISELLLVILKLKSIR